MFVRTLFSIMFGDKFHLKYSRREKSRDLFELHFLFFKCVFRQICLLPTFIKSLFLSWVFLFNFTEKSKTWSVFFSKQDFQTFTRVTKIWIWLVAKSFLLVSRARLTGLLQFEGGSTGLGFCMFIWISKNFFRLVIQTCLLSGTSPVI